MWSQISPTELRLEFRSTRYSTNGYHVGQKDCQIHSIWHGSQIWHKFKISAIFWWDKKFLKIGLPKLNYPMGQNFVEIALPSTVFEIQGFLCFAFLKKIQKFKMATIFGK